MRFQDIEALPEVERAPALEDWFIEHLEHAGIRAHRSNNRLALAASFTHGGTTYSCQTRWLRFPLDADAVKDFAGAAAAMGAAALVLSMSGYTDEARAAARGMSVVVLLLDRADAAEIEESGIERVLASGLNRNGEPEPARRRKPLNWKRVAGTAVAVSGLLGTAIGLADYYGPEDPPPPPPPTTTANPDPGIEVILDPPVDLREVVSLRWKGPPGVNYFVEYWRDGSSEAQHQGALRSTDAKVKVDANGIYCFRVRAIRADNRYGVSNIEPVRGATCMVLPG